MPEYVVRVIGTEVDETVRKKTRETAMKYCEKVYKQALKKYEDAEFFNEPRFDSLTGEFKIMAEDFYLHGYILPQNDLEGSEYVAEKIRRMALEVKSYAERYMCDLMEMECDYIADQIKLEVEGLSHALKADHEMLRHFEQSKIGYSTPLTLEEAQTLKRGVAVTFVSKPKSKQRHSYNALVTSRCGGDIQLLSENGGSVYPDWDNYGDTWVIQKVNV